MSSPNHRLAGRILIVAGLCGWLGCGTVTPQPDPDFDDPAGQSFDDRIGSGQARVTGTIRSADVEDPLPLGGVRVSLGDASAISNVDGSFVLLGVSGGVQSLVVDASELRAGDGRFGRFVGSIDVAPDSDLFIDRPVYIAFIPDSAGRAVHPFEDATVAADGVTLNVPAGAARHEGVEFDGIISIRGLHPSRTPLALPERFDDEAIRVVDMQPAGIGFPVPVNVRFGVRNGGGAAEFKLLWSWLPESGTLERVALMERVGNQWVVAAGGVRQSGVHVLADYEVSLIQPCDDQAPEMTRGCLSAWMEARRAFDAIARPSAPGSFAVFQSLNAALETRNGTDPRARDILASTLELYGLAQDRVASYQAFYRGLQDLAELEHAVTQAEAACTELDPCRAPSDATIDGAALVAALTDAANEHAFRFDRLRAAVEALAPFYALTEPLAEETLADFESVAVEFNRAYDDFAPLGSPIEAYDELVERRARISRFVRDRIESFSTAVGASAAVPGARLMRVCPEIGVTASRAVADEGGIVAWDAGGADFGIGGAGECTLIAMDEEGGQTTLPAPETAAIRSAGPEATLALDRAMRFFDTRLDRIESGSLDVDTPVHVWRFSGAQRAGVAVSFDSTGDAMAGIASHDGIIRIARRGGFGALNLPGGEPLSLYVWSVARAGTPGPLGGGSTSGPLGGGSTSGPLGGGSTSGPLGDGSTLYDFSIAPTPSLFDFGTPVNGEFDVFHRGEVILLDAAAPRRLLVERSCCDRFGAAWSFVMRGPGGAVVPSTDGDQAGFDLESAVFDLPQPGRYSLSIVPEAGSFGAYGVVIRDVPVNPPIDYAPGTIADGILDDRGERIDFRFAGSANSLAVLEGIASVELGPLLVTVATADGAIVLPETLLFFDGSSFSTRTLRLPQTGDYVLSFRAPVGDGPMTGTFRFQLVLEDAEPVPQPESNPG